MVRRMHLKVNRPTLRGEWIVLSAAIRGHPAWRKRNGTLRFEVPAARAEWLVMKDRPDDLHDAFLRAVIFSAMEAGRELVVHGRVSTSLLENLERFQRIIHAWWPEQYRPVRVCAEAEISGAEWPHRRPGREALLGFSGGLDSLYTLYRHQQGLAGGTARRLPVCVFVHGFDIPLGDACYGAAFERAGRMTAALGSTLVPMRTNLKRMLPLWGTTHTAALTAVLSLFERRFTTGLIAPDATDGDPYALAAKLGRKSFSDPFLSSATFRVVVDEDRRPRVEKSEMLRDRPLLRQNLRVCWQGDDLAGNCGRCEKCVRQMLCLKAIGIDDLRAFRAPLVPGRIIAVRPGLAVLREWRTCYREARARGRASAPEFVAMRRAIELSEAELAAARRDAAGSGSRAKAA